MKKKVDLTWYPIKGYEGLYEIRRDKSIRSLHKRNKTGKIKIRIDRGGYETVRLTKNGVTKTHWIHRLLLQTFSENQHNKCCVNHKDGNKLNNEIENLEWVTHAENMRHASLIGLFRQKKSKGDQN